MSASNPLPSIGFLSVCEYSGLGLIGGYLLLNTSGRPLEFHCTAPVRPNRTQEILYGPTLTPYLYGEQIAVTLLEKARSQPLFVCTDLEAVLAARKLVSVPLVWLPMKESAEGKLSATSRRVDSGHAPPSPHKPRRLVEFELAHRSAAVWESHIADRDQILQLWSTHGEEVDLAEPFGRVQEALEEAQRGITRPGS